MLRARSALAAMLLMGLMLAAFATPARADYYNYADELCRNQTALQEQVSGIPAHVLTAISMVESGRWDGERQARIAWPWTVTNGGSGKFFRTKAEAIAHVKMLQARGEWNIDVGCMQINLHYHGDEFSSLDKAFEPKANVAYAAKFLTALYKETGSWTRAVQRYHSATPVHAERYIGKFRIAWREAQEYAQVAGLPPVRDIVGEARLMEATRELERQQMEAQRAQDQEEARRVADAWRAEKLKAWLARREARAESAVPGGEDGNRS
ncbi:transglycosylase SLT domain-containing protein [Roseospira marina]|nr:transglycosylase SLT domain-containing protein [Roseospira marina]MBB4312167.1 hypothetical protein [Roseospira marina]MBB5085817.1 hypothetical protein [Roseospira marina]